MKSYKVLLFNFGANREPEWHDIMPYLIDEYKQLKTKPKTVAEFMHFVDNKCKYMYWSRCEYEILISSWPTREQPELIKIDAYDQIFANLEVVARVLMSNVIKNEKNKN